MEKPVEQKFDAREKTPRLKAFFIKSLPVPFLSRGMKKL